MQSASGHQKVHLWKIRLDADDSSIERFGRLLSPEEREQASRFKLDRDCMRYTVSHGALRLILCRYLHSHPASLVLAPNRYGKPYLIYPSSSGLFFSLSHSGDMALVAVCSNQEVGVDIEQVQADFPLDTMMAYSAFSESERQCVTHLPEAEQAAECFRLWTRKEAYLKFKGTGLSDYLNPTEVMQLTLPAEIIDINGIHGYAATLCIERATDIEFLDFSTSDWGKGNIKRL